MNKKSKDLKAINESIKHWKDIIENPHHNFGLYDCALCYLYHSDYAGGENYTGIPCKGCPISNYTKMINCENTPYTEAEIAADNEDLENVSIAARKMVKFLIKIKQRISDET